jgi:hypothetical protein
MFRPDRIRQLKQLMLGGLGRRERVIMLELHRACMRVLKRPPPVNWRASDVETSVLRS